MAQRQHCYPYPRPALTADIAVFTLHENRLKLLLIRRKSDPFAGKWALPGGFVNEGERIIDAAERELAEETGVTSTMLHEFASFGDPGRDPRGWTVTVAFFTLLAWNRLSPQAADDAAAVGWFAIEKLPRLAFDHRKIIGKAVSSLRAWPMRALVRSGCVARGAARSEVSMALKVLLGKPLSPSAVTAIMKRER